MAGFMDKSDLYITRRIDEVDNWMDGWMDV